LRAQYEVWADVTLKYSTAQAELDKAAQFNGQVYVDIGTENPNRDQSRVGSFLKYEMETVNNGSRECEITKLFVWLTAPNMPKMAIPFEIQPTTVAPKKSFRRSEVVIVQMTSPEDLRKSDISIDLIDAVGNHYPVRTVVTNRVITTAETLKIMNRELAGQNVFHRHPLIH
jgi:hypothetical protein